MSDLEVARNVVCFLAGVITGCLILATVVGGKR